MNATRRLLMLCIGILCTLCADAQEFKVKDFKQVLTDISASQKRKYDSNDEACALIKVQYPKEGATFDGNVVDTLRNGNEYWVYVSKGTKRIKINIPEHPTLSVEFADFGVTPAESSTTYVVVLQFPSAFKASFYAEAGMLVGKPMCPEFSVGAYLGGFNVEVGAMLPMGVKESVFCQSGNEMPQEFEYKPSISLVAKIGYGIMATENIRVTPQVGLRYTSLTETAVSNTSLAPAKGANCGSLTIGCKLQYLISKNFAVSLTPEYAAAAAKSKGYKALCDASTEIGKWNNGIGVKLALNVEF